MRHLLLAICTSVVALGLAAPAQGTASVNVERYAGADRYETAARIALESFPHAGDPPLGEGTASVVIVRGDKFPDALAASYVAGQAAGPILLTTVTRLPEVTIDALEQLGASRAFILGDETAVSNAVESELESMEIEVVRLSGADRYETASAAVRSYAGSNGTFGLDGRRPAIIASGEGFADALAAAAVAYGERFPLLLTPHDHLHDSIPAALSESQIDLVFVVGGTAAVSSSVDAEIEALDVEVRRLAGANRQETAVAIAEFARTELGWPMRAVSLATGAGFADALAGAGIAGQEQASLLLTESANELSETTRSYLAARRSSISTVIVLGGTAAVSEEVAEQARAAATGV